MRDLLQGSDIADCESRTPTMWLDSLFFCWFVLLKMSMQSIQDWSFTIVGYWCDITDSKQQAECDQMWAYSFSKNIF